MLKLMSLNHFFHIRKKHQVTTATQLIEIKTGHHWRVQQENRFFGTSHFLIKRIEYGYEPTYIMLSERGVRIRFETICA